APGRFPRSHRLRRSRVVPCHTSPPETSLFFSDQRAVSCHVPRQAPQRTDDGVITTQRICELILLGRSFPSTPGRHPSPAPSHRLIPCRPLGKSSRGRERNGAVMKISLVLGDSTEQHVDAVVNAANSSLLGG